MGFEVEHVNEEAARRLGDLADRVRATLVAAGIPASLTSASGVTGPPQGGGAEIMVDTVADMAGGVYISWSFPQAQNAEFLGYLLARPDVHPRLEYFFEVRRAMRDAIIAILGAAGLTAILAENRNDLAHLQVLVHE
jgi:hypothetical protein